MISLQLTVSCHPKKTAPCEMSRGSVTTDSQFAYFAPHDSTSVYKYDWTVEQWEELPLCSYENSGLVMINDELIAVGGSDGFQSCTNKLLTLRQVDWVEEYPPMKTARSSPAVVCTPYGGHRIVIGGGIGDCSGGTTAVELFHVKNRVWYRLTDFPEPFPLPSATVCGGQLNVVGTSVMGYSCSLQELPSSDQPLTSPLVLCWKPLPQLVRATTVATLCGQLVSIGGEQGPWSPFPYIHQLLDGQWVTIGCMTSDRYECLVASPYPDRIIIMGGIGEDHTSNVVEECFVTQ